MIPYLGLSDGLWKEVVLITFYIFSRVDVRLVEPKMKLLGERDINYIFVGYTEIPMHTCSLLYNLMIMFWLIPYMFFVL